MSADRDEYSGPDRRKLPRASTLPPDASIWDRCQMRLDVLKQLVVGHHLEDHRELPHDGARA